MVGLRGTGGRGLGELWGTQAATRCATKRAAGGFGHGDPHSDANSNSNADAKPDPDTLANVRKDEAGGRPDQSVQYASAWQDVDS